MICNEPQEQVWLSSPLIGPTTDTTNHAATYKRQPYVFKAVI